MGYKIYEDFYGFSIRDRDNNYMFETDTREKANKIINALERQIPQKPREHYHWGDFTKEEKLENNQWFCGKCDWQIGEEDNYCNECGQRVERPLLQD